MKLRIFSQFGLLIPATLLAIVMMIILVACGSSAPTAVSTQPPSPTQVATLEPQPADTQPSAATPASVQTQAPADRQGAAPTTSPAGYSLTSVCPLITKEEAEAALGGQVKDPEEQNYPPVFSCRYYGTLNGVEGIYFVDVAVVEFPNAEQAAGVFQMAIDLNQYPEVSGLSDRAYTSDIYDITVDKGKFELSINVLTDEDKETRVEKAKVLAASALERLP